MLISRLLAFLAVSLLGGAIAMLPGSGQAQDVTPAASPMAGETTTAAVVSATNDPLRVSGSDGVDHLEYDLLVTNGGNFLLPNASVPVGAAIASLLAPESPMTGSNSAP